MLKSEGTTGATDRICQHDNGGGVVGRDLGPWILFKRFRNEYVLVISVSSGLFDGFALSFDENGGGSGLFGPGPFCH